MRVLQCKAPASGPSSPIGDYSRLALALLAAGWFCIGLAMMTRKMDSLVRCRFTADRPPIHAEPRR